MRTFVSPTLPLAREVALPGPGRDLEHRIVQIDSITDKISQIASQTLKPPRTPTELKISGVAPGVRSWKPTKNRGSGWTRGIDAGSERAGCACAPQGWP